MALYFFDAEFQNRGLNFCYEFFPIYNPNFTRLLQVVLVTCDSTIDLLQCYYLQEVNLWFLVLGLVYYWCCCLALEQPKLYTSKSPF